MRALKILVSVMGVLIVVATVALVVLVIQRMNRAAQGVGGGAALISTELALKQPEGSRIGGIATLDGRLAIWVERPDGGRVLLVDPATLRQTGEIHLGQ